MKSVIGILAGAALIALAAAADAAELQELLPALRDTTAIVRIQTMNRIADLKDPGDDAALAVLDLTLRDPDDEVRTWGRFAVERFKNSGAAMMTRIEAALEDPVQRANAVETIGHLSAVSERALPLLMAQARDTSLRKPIGESFDAVRRVRPEQVSALVALFADCDPTVRYHVGGALVGAGSFAVPNLIPLSTNSDWNVRANTVRALGMIGETDGAVGKALIAAAGDPDYRVRGSALQALERMGTGTTHDFLVRRNGGIETHGAVTRSLELRGSAVKPDTTIVAVAAEYIEQRKPLAHSGRPTTVVLAREQRLYVCDVETRTSRMLARIDVPGEMRWEPHVAVLGWAGDSVVVRIGGQPSRSYSGFDFESSSRLALVDPGGSVRYVEERPRVARAASTRHRYLDVSIRGDRIEKRVVGGPSVRVFTVDEKTAELLPASP